MSVQHYAVIDSSGTIVNKIVYKIGDVPPNPHPCHPNHSIVPCDESTGQHSDGWTYINGKFVAPPKREPILTSSLPEPPPTKEQTDIAALKSDIQTLTQSLTQVITALNALTQSKVATPHVE
jgi:hypothetical protein